MTLCLLCKKKKKGRDLLFSKLTFLPIKVEIKTLMSLHQPLPSARSNITSHTLWHIFTRTHRHIFTLDVSDSWDWGSLLISTAKKHDFIVYPALLIRTRMHDKFGEVSVDLCRRRWWVLLEFIQVTTRCCEGHGWHITAFLKWHYSNVHQEERLKIISLVSWTTFSNL